MDDSSIIESKLSSWIVGADVWPHQIVSMALSFAFEVTVHVYDLINEGPMIELTRSIERPRSEFVGDLREVRVLFANKVLHSVLTSEEATNGGISGINMLLDDAKFVVVGQPNEANFAFGPIGWLVMEQKLVTPAMLQATGSQCGDEFVLLDQREYTKFQELFESKSSTTAFRRSAPEAVIIDGIKVNRFTALGDITGPSSGNYFLGLQVQVEEKQGVLMDIIQSKKLTNSHMYGRVEFLDGSSPGFTFVIIKSKCSVTVSQPVRRAGTALMAQLSKHTLEDRIRAFPLFKDKLNAETGQSSGPPRHKREREPVPSTPGAKRVQTTSTSSARPTKKQTGSANEDNTADLTQVLCVFFSIPLLARHLPLMM